MPATGNYSILRFIHNKQDGYPKKIFIRKYLIRPISKIDVVNPECFNILTENGFDMEDKTKQQTSHHNIWIEKTIVNGRLDRMAGERSLGVALWSPRKDKRGADIYKNMRFVRQGDIVLHLIDNQKISGVSIAKSTCIETTGLAGSNWAGPAYLIELVQYTALEPTIDRTEFLKEENRPLLENIAKRSEVFYNDELNLRQGAYLTPCPLELFKIDINEKYKSLSGENLPFKEKIDFGTTIARNTHNVNGTIMEHLSKYLSIKTKPFIILAGISGSGKI